MAEEEDRLRRYKRVLKSSQPVDKCYPKGRSTKRESYSKYPPIMEHWLEIEENPWSGQGTGPHGSGHPPPTVTYQPSHLPRAPMVRSYGGRDSIVANYRVPASYKSQFHPAVGVPLSPSPQSPPQYQSPAPRSWSYSSPPKYAASQSSSVNPSQFVKPVFSQPSATVVSGEGGNCPGERFFGKPIRRDLLQEDEMDLEFQDQPLNVSLLDTSDDPPTAPLTLEGSMNRPMSSNVVNVSSSASSGTPEQLGSNSPNC